MRQDLQDNQDIFLPFQMKGKKFHPSSREAMNIELPGLLRFRNGRLKLLSTPMGRIEFSPFHQGREKYKKDPRNPVHPV